MNNIFKVFDRYVTPEKWKKDAVEKAFAEKPRLKRGQLALAVCATAAVLVGLVTAPFLASRMTDVPDLSPGSESSQADSGEEISLYEGMPYDELYSFMKTKYDEVVYGIVLAPKDDYSRITVYTHGTLLNQYGVAENQVRIDSFDITGTDYTGGVERSMVSATMGINVGDWVLLGYNRYYIEYCTGLGQITREKPKGYTYSEEYFLEGYANLGKSRDQSFLRIAECAKAICATDDLNDSRVCSIILETYRQWNREEGTVGCDPDDVHIEQDSALYYEVTEMPILADASKNFETTDDGWLKYYGSCYKHVFRIRGAPNDDLSGAKALKVGDSLFGIDFGEEYTPVMFTVDVQSEETVTPEKAEVIPDINDPSCVYLSVEFTVSDMEEYGLFNKCTISYHMTNENAYYYKDVSPKEIAEKMEYESKWTLRYRFDGMKR